MRVCHTYSKNIGSPCCPDSQKGWPRTPPEQLKNEYDIIETYVNLKIICLTCTSSQPGDGWGGGAQLWSQVGCKMEDGFRLYRYDNYLSSIASFENKGAQYMFW